MQGLESNNRQIQDWEQCPGLNTSMEREWPLTRTANTNGLKTHTFLAFVECMARPEVFLDSDNQVLEDLNKKPGLKVMATVRHNQNQLSEWWQPSDPISKNCEWVYASRRA
jgi:hypothetical protein